MTTISSNARLSGGKHRVYASAFGKHPGWDDHIEEMGLETDALVRMKRVMYSEGMGGNIDSGAWEKLDESQRLAEFNHIFYWRTPEGTLIGRMWSSTDGKGRSRYPMIVAAMVAGAPLAWAIDQILPRLETVAKRCGATKDQDEVRAALAECKRGLEDAAAMLESAGPLSGTGRGGAGSEEELLKRLVSHPDMNAEGKDRLGLERVLYEIDRELTAFRPGGTKNRTSISAAMGPHMVRVPKCLNGPGEGARAWNALMKGEVSGSVPMLMIEPREGKYLDIIVGEPVPAAFFCVRANEAALPLTSVVPYTIPADFAKASGEKIERFLSGRGLAASAAPPSVNAKGNEPAAGDVGRPKKPAWLIPAVGGGLVAAGLIVILLVVVARSTTGGGSNANPPIPEVPIVKNDSGEGTKVPDEPKPSPDAPKKPPASVETSVVPPPSAPTPPPPTPPSVLAEKDDPRSGWKYAELEAKVIAAADALDAEAVAEGATSPPSIALREKLKRVKEDVGMVKAYRLTGANRDTILTGMSGVDKDLQTTLNSAEEAKSASEAKLRTHLVQTSGQPPVKGDAAAKIWSSRVSGIDAAAGWRAAKAQLNELATAMGEAEKSAGSLKEMAAPVPVAGVDVAALVAAAAKKREALAEAAGSAAASGKKEEAAAKGQEWAAWQADVKSSAASAGVLSAALVDGDAQAAATAGAALRANPLAVEIPGAFAALLSAENEAARIQSELDAAKLIAAVKAAGEAGGDAAGLKNAAAGAAVKRLPVAQGMDAARLGLTMGLMANIEKASARIGDETRRRAFVAAAESAIWETWHKFMASRGGDRTDLLSGYAAAQTAGADRAKNETAKLPVWVRYNALVVRLQDAISVNDAKEEDRRAAIGAFLNDATELGSGVTGAATVKEFVTKAQGALAQKAAADVAKFGPGAKGWAYKAGPDGAAVFTSPSKSPNPAALTFLPLKSGSDGAGAYVCTTEASLGMFMDAVSSAGKWEDVLAVLAKTGSARSDTRKGPRSWVWNATGPATMLLARSEPPDLSAGWLTGIKDLKDQPYYAPDLLNAPAAPSLNSPMQYVSPHAAVMVAAWVGCRLPTSAEWKAAGDRATRKVNRRDPTWKRQFDHVVRINGLGAGTQFPNLGLFSPANAAGSTPDADGEAAVQEDDGLLWFSPSGGEGSGAGFENLVGNVAEFVMEGNGESPPTTEPAAIDKWLNRGVNVRVIGGSALSPKSIDPATAYAFVWTSSKVGYSDVGFRLAFSVPSGVGGAGGEGATDWKVLAAGAVFLRGAESDGASDAKPK